MKQIIVLFAMVGLGIAIYGFLMGSGQDTVFQNVKHLWHNQLEQQKQFP